MLRRRYRFYYLSGLVFLVWMLFFDANDLRSQFRNWLKLRELKEEQAFYEAETKRIAAERREVLGSQRLRIKYAREKYLMKKRTEDVYVLVDEQRKPIEP
jgi:cell division protein DivIC